MALRHIKSKFDAHEAELLTPPWFSFATHLAAFSGLSSCWLSFFSFESISKRGKAILIRTVYEGALYLLIEWLRNWCSCLVWSSLMSTYLHMHHSLYRFHFHTEIGTKMVHGSLPVRLHWNVSQICSWWILVILTLWSQFNEHCGFWWQEMVWPNLKSDPLTLIYPEQC